LKKYVNDVYEVEDSGYLIHILNIHILYISFVFVCIVRGQFIRVIENNKHFILYESQVYLLYTRVFIYDVSIHYLGSLYYVFT